MHRFGIILSAVALSFQARLKHTKTKSYIVNCALISWKARVKHTVCSGVLELILEYIDTKEGGDEGREAQVHDVDDSPEDHTHYAWEEGA